MEVKVVMEGMEPQAIEGMTLLNLLVEPMGVQEAMVEMEAVVEMGILLIILIIYK
jgi:hypothetical protein